MLVVRLPSPKPRSSCWSLVRNGEARAGSDSVGLLRVVSSSRFCIQSSGFTSSLVSLGKGGWRGGGICSRLRRASALTETLPIFSDVSSQQAAEFKVLSNALQDPLDGSAHATGLSCAFMLAHIGSFLCARNQMAGTISLMFSKAVLLSPPPPTFYT